MPDSVFMVQGATIIPCVKNDPLAGEAARSWLSYTVSARASTSSIE